MIKNNLPTNLEFLLEKKWVNDFFNKNSEQVFGSKKNFELVRIDRAYAMSPQSYNILYQFRINEQLFSIRASSSTLASRNQTYKTLKFVYENGFSGNKITVPKPIFYFEDINLMLYQNVTGPVLLYELKNIYEKLEPKILLAAQALKKIHQLSKPGFNLSGPKWEFKIDRINRYLHKEDKINEILINLNELLKNISTNFCHGDYQPNNLIIGEGKITIIDFGSVCLAGKELDIASFICQLETMLQRENNLQIFENLKKIFLENYGNYDKKYFEAYSFYHSLQILDSLIAFFENDPHPDKAEVSSAINHWTKKINKMILG